jgi:hypothetical protein
LWLAKKSRAHFIFKSALQNAGCGAFPEFPQAWPGLNFIKDERPRACRFRLKLSGSLGGALFGYSNL